MLIDVIDAATIIDSIHNDVAVVDESVVVEIVVEGVVVFHRIDFLGDLLIVVGDRVEEHG